MVSSDKYFQKHLFTNKWP